MKTLTLGLAFLISASVYSTIPGNFWRTDGDLTSWNNLLNAGQITTDQLKTSSALMDLDGSGMNYLAPGTYSPAFLTVSGKLTGGFSGNETSINTEDRALSDQDGNGIVEPWEFTNIAKLTSSQINGNFTGTGTNVNRILTVTGDGAEVNGVTITDFHYSTYSGAISLGVAAGTPSAANNVLTKAGSLRLCIVKKIKNTPLSTTHSGGVIMLTNQHSLIDRCLVEDNVSLANNSGGGVFMNLFGGKVLNSVIRNNASVGSNGRGGGVYASTSAATGDLNAMVINCLIYNNVAVNGGAIRVDAQVGKRGIQVVNSTIVNNKTTGNTASVEFIQSGLIANSIVVNQSLAEGGTEVRCHAANHYFSNTVYGDSTYTAGGTKAGNSGGKVTADIKFINPTTFTGIMIPDYTPSFDQVSYDAIRQANFTIDPVNASSSPAITLESLKSLPVSYSYTGGASAISITASVPTTDMLGNDRPVLTNSHLDLGAYQTAGLSTNVNNATLKNVYCSAFDKKISMNNVHGLTIKVYTVTGLLYTTINATSNQLNIDMPNGIYLVKSEKFTEKVVVR